MHRFKIKPMHYFFVFVYIVKYDTHLLKPKVVQWYNVTNYHMSKDYLIVNKD